MERQVPEASSSLERFRKSSGKKRDTQTASDDEIRDAIRTGIQDAESKQLDARQLKDKTNVVRNWIANNMDKLMLSAEEAKKLTNHEEVVRNTFEDYKWAARLWSIATKEQSFRDTAQEYLQFAQMLVNRVEREQDKQNMGQLKTSMKSIFRANGPIQLLSEERFTFQIMDETLKHPDLTDKFMQLLQHSVSEDHTLNNHSKTALAFKYASEYLSLKRTSNKLLNASPEGSQSKAFRPDLAEQAMEIVEQEKTTIIGNPNEVLFYGNQVSKQTKTKIEAGTTLPSIIWREEIEEVMQPVFEKELGKVQLQKDGSEKWEEQKKYAHRRNVFDLSSLSLSYQGQRLKSLEIIDSYTARGFQNSPTPYINMKLTTMNSQNYFSFSDGSLGDPTSGIVTLVHPFLSGKQHERDWPFLSGKLPKDFWQNKDQDWHLEPDHRKAYYSQIHPAMTRYACSAIEHLIQSDKKKKVTILDVAGGNGDLGERILKEIRKQFPDLQVTYRLVDYSQNDVTIANERFDALRTKRVDALAVTKDMLSYGFNADTMKADQALGLPEYGVDLVINSGGLLNHTITDDPQVPIRFNEMYSNLMTRGGFGVYSGLSSLLVNAEHHKSLGLEIRNLFDENIPSGQMHVVRCPKIDA